MRGMGGVLGFGGGGLRVWDEGLVLVYAKSFTKLTFWLRSSGISGSLNWVYQEFRSAGSWCQSEAQDSQLWASSLQALAIRGLEPVALNKSLSAPKLPKPKTLNPKP